MSDIAYQEAILTKAAELLQAVSESGQLVFRQVTRGRPLLGALELTKRPAAFIEQLGIRPETERDQYEDMDEQLAFFQVVIVGTATEEHTKGPELNRLEALVYQALTTEQLADGWGGLISLLLRKGVDGPLHNASFPMGAITAMYVAGYAHERGNPFTS